MNHLLDFLNIVFDSSNFLSQFLHPAYQLYRICLSHKATHLSVCECTFCNNVPWKCDWFSLYQSVAILTNMREERLTSIWQSSLYQRGLYVSLPVLDGVDPSWLMSWLHILLPVFYWMSASHVHSSGDLPVSKEHCKLQRIRINVLSVSQSINQSALKYHDTYSMFHHSQ